MPIPKIIETAVITNSKKFTLFVFIYICGGMLLTVYLGTTLHSLSLLFLGLFIFMVSPFIFQKYFRKRFSEKADVTFFDDYFSIELKKIDSDIVLRTDINRFDQIKLFKTFDNPKNDFSRLKLIFKDGSKLSYTFSGQQNDDICETDINRLFRKAVEIYNASRKMGEKIKIIPSFFSTKTALYLGLILTLAMAIVTIYFGIQKPKTLLVSIGFIGIFFQMVAMRKKAIKEKNKFS